MGFFIPRCRCWELGLLMFVALNAMTLTRVDAQIPEPSKKCVVGDCDGGGGPAIRDREPVYREPAPPKPPSKSQRARQRTAIGDRYYRERNWPAAIQEYVNALYILGDEDDDLREHISGNLHTAKAAQAELEGDLDEAIAQIELALDTTSFLTKLFGDTTIYEQRKEYLVGLKQKAERRKHRGAGKENPDDTEVCVLKPYRDAADQCVYECPTLGEQSAPGPDKPCSRLRRFLLKYRDREPGWGRRIDPKSWSVPMSRGGM